MSDIRPLLVSYDDILGGAARSMYRLHVALLRQGIESRILAARKTSADPAVSEPWLYRSRIRRRILGEIEHVPDRLYMRRKPQPTPWSTNLLPTLRDNEFNRYASNLIHLHWVGSGFVPIRTLRKIHKPIVWTMHDMWTFTGGCHYSGACTRYVDTCGACPQLASSQPSDLSRLIWRTKAQQWQPLHMTLVSPSRWLADCAAKSSLFYQKRIETIPYGLDTEIYRPMAKQEVRTELGLPLDAKLILFGAMDSTSDPRKGYTLLLPALHRLVHDYAQEQHLENLQLVVLGANRPSSANIDAMPPLPIHYAGYVYDESKIAAIYAAADLFVAPSIEDNLPNTVMEAIACGVPSVAFNIGGMPDMIEHQANGYLATPFAVEDLAKGMAWVLADSERYEALADRARIKTLEEFTLGHTAKSYKALYEELLQASFSNPKRVGQ